MNADLDYEQVLGRLASEPQARVRVAARRTDDGLWTYTMLDVVTGEAAVPRAWEYPTALFMEFDADGRDIAAALDECTIVHAGHRVTIAATDPRYVVVRRRQSQQASQYGTLTWPSLDHDLGTPPPPYTSSDALIGRGAPSFVTYQYATAALFDGDVSANPSFGTAAVCVRFPDRRARIETVILGAADLTVVVHGGPLTGLRAELAGNRPGAAETLADPGPATVVFPLPEGLPPGAWVLVRDDHDWLDRRFLAWPHAAQPEAGVTIEQPGPLIGAVVAAGEGPAVEFKREPPGPGEARRRVARTVAAFANGDGGTVLFGIEDDGSSDGLPPEDVLPAALDGMTNWIRDLVVPVPEFTVTAQDAPAGTGKVIALTVAAGALPPYGVEPSNPRYYIRRGATTFPASADQVRALARARPDADRLSPLLFR